MHPILMQSSVWSSSREFTAIALPILLGLVGIYLLLPRPRNMSQMWGGICAVAALLLGGLFLLRREWLDSETPLFYSFSAIAIVAGCLLVTQSNPAKAALSFALVIMSTCGLFLLQAAPFLMAATTIVYAGAIIVTFIFVIMLAQQAGRSDADARSREPLLSCVAGFVLLASILYVLQYTYSPFDPKKDNDDTIYADLEVPMTIPMSSQSALPLRTIPPGTPPPHSRMKLARKGLDERIAMPAENVAFMGRTLFTDYLLAVELGGTLLTIATVGAIAITGRRAEERK